MPDVPVVALEPSCLAVLRVDAEELLADGAPPVSSRLVTLAEHLASLPGWEPPSLAGTSVVAQPHCHHASVLGWAADEALLRRWIGPQDLRALFRRCVEAAVEGFHVVYGISAQPTSPYDLSHTKRILAWQPRQLPPAPESP